MKTFSTLFRRTCVLSKILRRSVNVHNLATADSTVLPSKQNSFASRSHNCGELSEKNVGESVKLKGWLQFQRMGFFFTLRDSYGTTQIKIDTHELQEIMKNTSFESVLEIEGTVSSRPDDDKNKSMKTGDIEVIAEKINVLNKCKPDMPFQMHSHHKVNEPLRMQYRYLDLRSKELQRNLRLRSKIVMKMRQFLCDLHGFVDVETPTLFRRTPGGAREFVVPTHTPGKFYSLPQSPQQFKQLLMVGGIDRYMQIAKCYRDESGRPDRQPEFTQVDIEMSFVTQEAIKQLIEELLVYSWPEEKQPISTPFPRMSYHEAMSQYGVDKPDLRLDRITEVSNVFRGTEFPPIRSQLANGGKVKALVIKKVASHISNKELDEIQKTTIEQQKAYTMNDLNQSEATQVKGSADQPKEEVMGTRETVTPQQWLAITKVKADGTLAGSLHRKMGVELEALKQVVGYQADDVVMLSAGVEYTASEVIGRVRGLVDRLLLQRDVNLRGDRQDDTCFLWVEDFPLFLAKEEGEGLESAHHPFTAPREGQEHLVYSQPQQVVSQHYDLVLNGFEVGGGSIRIYNSALQRYILEDVLKEDTSQLEHLLEALDSGCPPHGGIALGLDRLLAVICGAASIRDVIAFPKLNEGQDPMSRAPAEINAQDKQYYHLSPTTGNVK